MSKTYIVKQGDTLENISARQYGDPSLYLKLLYANPFLNPDSVLSVGSSIVIPVLSTSLGILDNISDPDEVTINIDGDLLTDWFDIKVLFSIDSVADSFSFKVPFSFDVESQRQRFLPFSFKQVTIFFGSELVLTGTIVNIIPDISPEAATLSIEGYSTPGILNDCNFPASSYPLEFNNLKLGDIVNEAAAFFNLTVVDNVNDSYVFNELDVDPSDKVYRFLAGLCKKRSVLINSDASGNIQLLKSSSDKSTFSLLQGNPTIVSVAPTLTGQTAYTTITGILQYNDFDDEAQANTHTETDTFMVGQGVSRPFVFHISNLEDGTIENAVKSKLRRGWASRISYRVTLSDWRTPEGDLWSDNLIFSLNYPGAMIYKDTDFLVRSATLSTNAESQKTTELEIVLPQSYNDEDLETLPWLD